MKKILKLAIFALCIAALCTMFVSCDEKDPTPVDYTVTIRDGLGKPISDVIVRFVDPDGAQKTKITNTEGQAAIKDSLVSSYTVKLEAGQSDAYITQSEYTINSDSPTLDLVLRNGATTVSVYGLVDEGAYAYTIGSGTYNVSVTSDEMSYFVFYAERSGVYKVSLTSDDADATVGFYGVPMYVQTSHITDTPDTYDGKSFDLIIQDKTTPYVLGINSSSAGACTLSVERTGEPPFNPEYADWTTVTAKADLEKLTLPKGTALTNIDVTDPSVSVTLGNDGFYYTSAGKQVYVRITSTTDYLDASLALLAGYVSDKVGINIGGYIYDDNGNFVAKESYNAMIKTYMDYCDTDTGICPLTEELAKAIQVHGNSAGWWNSDSGNYLFGAEPIVKENAWLFLCCVIDD